MNQMLAVPQTEFENEDQLEVLRQIVDGTAHLVGIEFFESLVNHLADIIGVQYALVAELESSKTRVRTKAFWTKGRVAENIEYNLDGTPCSDVIGGQLCHHPCNVQQKFPLDLALVDLAIESYLGVPLIDCCGKIIGHMAVFDERQMPQVTWCWHVLKIFATRAAAELQRLQIQERLENSEQRFRDLFDEAPIAYVFEDTETRFVKANQAALQLLGLRQDEVVGTVGMSLVAPDQSTQQNIREAFANIQQGKQHSLPELELRRKDNGQPVWVQFWSRPEPDGKLTRTMILDITDRVLSQKEQARLMQQTNYLQEEIKESRNYEEIIGRSHSLKQVLQHVQAVAPTDATVLIHGETGTGKELIARAIHATSKRSRKPLIKINCAALPANLIESELFGHEKGAFTGASTRRIGRFELAHEGTIFLDEIGELPLELQAKLLRVLQEQELDRIGGRETIRVNVRVIAATNRDLAQASKEKQFREDLYYRLNVFPIQLPPLRKRTADIPILAQYYLDRFASRMGKRIGGINAETLDRLVNYSWPGNIRELENVMERAVILCNEEVLSIEPRFIHGGFQEDSPTDSSSQHESSTTRPESSAALSLEEVEKAHIVSVLEKTGGRIEGVGGAASVLQVHPNTLRSRMKKLGITKPSK